MDPPSTCYYICTVYGVGYLLQNGRRINYDPDRTALTASLHHILHVKVSQLINLKPHGSSVHSRPAPK